MEIWIKCWFKAVCIRCHFSCFKFGLGLKVMINDLWVCHLFLPNFEMHGAEVVAELVFQNNLLWSMNPCTRMQNICFLMRVFANTSLYKVGLLQKSTNTHKNLDPYIQRKAAAVWSPHAVHCLGGRKLGLKVRSNCETSYTPFWKADKGKEIRRG